MFSKTLLQRPEAKNKAFLARIALAKKRVQSILDRETIAHQKTLEKKISEQGPGEQRVNPHLVGYAIQDLLELNRLRFLRHPATGNQKWYINPLTNDDDAQPKLDELAPLYASVSGGGFGNLTGDALEVVTYKCLLNVKQQKPRYDFQGAFHLDKPKNAENRFQKTQPQKTLSGKSTLKEADFIQFGHDAGALCIECKNYREWIYSHDNKIKELIVKSYELGAIPVLIARKIQYAAQTNLLEPAGIIAHESVWQYYPYDHHELAAKVAHKRKLGFSDVVATEEPHPRTMTFFEKNLPRIVAPMADSWNRNKEALYEYATDQINLAQLYTAIGSPAGGKWVEPEHIAPDTEY